MSWIKEQSGDALNLEFIKKIAVVPIERGPGEEDEEETHVVIAYGLDEESEWLFSGLEAACIDFRDKILNKLPMVRL